jgi:hypothetical protein
MGHGMDDRKYKEFADEIKTILSALGFTDWTGGYGHTCCEGFRERKISTVIPWTSWDI